MDNHEVCDSNNCDEYEDSGESYFLRPYLGRNKNIIKTVKLTTDEIVTLLDDRMEKIESLTHEYRIIEDENLKLRDDLSKLQLELNSLKSESNYKQTANRQSEEAFKFSDGVGLELYNLLLNVTQRNDDQSWNYIRRFILNSLCPVDDKHFHINLIKKIRSVTGLGLKDAKEMADLFRTLMTTANITFKAENEKEEKPT